MRGIEEREEILAGIMLTALLGPGGAHVAQALDPELKNRKTLEVVDAYAPQSPIDLVIMLKHGNEQFSIGVEIKRFNTNSNWLPSPGPKSRWKPHYLTPIGRKHLDLKNCGGLWQCDAASFTAVDTWWRIHADEQKYPVERFILLSPTSPTKAALDDFFPGAHSLARWTLTDYVDFGRSLSESKTAGPNTAAGLLLRSLVPA